ncbi:MAG: hypothetical protein WC223_13505 [Bacteroidales bacterium]|jgi:predicted transcriptional regulator
METKTKLNTTNPDHITMNYSPLELSILGGVRLDGLDRLRITIKIEHQWRALRHNLDLYNDMQTEKLVRRAAEKLEIGTSHISKALAELTTELEKYRLEQIAMKKEKQETCKALTAEQIKEATTFLQSDNLLQATNDYIGKSGVIGEEYNRILMYIIFTSRKREHPLHIISLGSSGTGKTYLQEKVGELIPEENKVEITTLSDNAFYYFGQQELQNKLILIEDLDGAENVMYPLRELQSKKRISKTVAHKDTRGNTRTVHLTVEGPVSVAGCTTKESIYEDNANRSFLIYPDESKEQDERIMEYQRKLSAGTINTGEQQKIKELLQNSQRILQPITVRNPYAEYLKIPEEVFKPRRTNSHYLQFIEAITFYKQYQREQKPDAETGELYIETTLEDINEANKLMKEILLRKSDELSGACRNYFEKLKLYLIGQQQKNITNREISQKLRIPLTTVKRYHLDLLNSGYLKRISQKENKAYHYEIVSYEEYKQLKANIETILDKQLEELKKNLSNHQQPKSPNQPTTKNGLVKTKTIRKKRTSAHQPTEMSKQENKIITAN